MAVFLFSAGYVFADGKMFAEQVNTSIPYQRALILFDEGRQIMVLQSQYEIPNDPGNHKLGWVVPVPTHPDLYSMESYEADWMFNILSLYTRPKPIISSGFSEWVRLVGMALGFGCFIVSLLLLVSTRKRRMRRVAVTFMLISVVSFPFTLLSTRAWKGARGVEVISTGQVGIYDTKVVRAESAQDLILKRKMGTLVERRRTGRVRWQAGHRWSGFFLSAQEHFRLRWKIG